MRVFVYEHLCATVAAGAAGSLAVEGGAMLHAVLADFVRCPGVTTTTLIMPGHAAPEGVRIAVGPADSEAAFRAEARAADFTLVIAPEFDEILASRCRWVEQEGGRLLGPSAAAVNLAADKLALFRHLSNNDIPTPETIEWTGSAAPPITFPFVYKPRDGAGSQATFLIADDESWRRSFATAADEGWSGPMIVQPFSAGVAASAALLIGRDRTVAMPPTLQDLSQDGRFHYLGGRLPLRKALAARATRLAERSAAVSPGLAGYVGFDLVLGAAEDGSQDVVVEVNPRLTTSYIGLRAQTEGNLAETLLALAEGRPVADLAWRGDEIRFTADGRVTRQAAPPI